MKLTLDIISGLEHIQEAIENWMIQLPEWTRGITDILRMRLDFVPQDVALFTAIFWLLYAAFFIFILISTISLIFPSKALLMKWKAVLYPPIKKEEEIIIDTDSLALSADNVLDIRPLIPYDILSDLNSDDAMIKLPLMEDNFTDNAEINIQDDCDLSFEKDSERNFLEDEKLENIPKINPQCVIKNEVEPQPVPLKTEASLRADGKARDFIKKIIKDKPEKINKRRITKKQARANMRLKTVFEDIHEALEDIIKPEDLTQDNASEDIIPEENLIINNNDSINNIDSNLELTEEILPSQDEEKDEDINEPFDTQAKDDIIEANDDNSFNTQDNESAIERTESDDNSNTLEEYEDKIEVTSQYESKEEVVAVNRDIILEDVSLSKDEAKVITDTLKIKEAALENEEKKEEPDSKLDNIEEVLVDNQVENDYYEDTVAEPLDLDEEIIVDRINKGQEDEELKEILRLIESEDASEAVDTDEFNIDTEEYGYPVANDYLEEDMDDTKVEDIDDSAILDDIDDATAIVDIDDTLTPEEPKILSEEVDRHPPAKVSFEDEEEDIMNFFSS